MSKNIDITLHDYLETITINGDKNRVISWSPSDLSIIDKVEGLKIYLMNGELDREIEEIKKAHTHENEKGEMEYTPGAMDKIAEILENKVDETFGKGVSQKAFVGVHPLTPTPSGTFFSDFVNAIAPIIEDRFKKNDEAINKYRDMYQKQKLANKGK